jgi:hypothetical protein
MLFLMLEFKESKSKINLDPGLSFLDGSFSVGNEKQTKEKSVYRDSYLKFVNKAINRLLRA